MKQLYQNTNSRFYYQIEFLSGILAVQKGQDLKGRIHYEQCLYRNLHVTNLDQKILEQDLCY